MKTILEKYEDLKAENDRLKGHAPSQSSRQSPVSRAVARNEDDLESTRKQLRLERDPRKKRELALKCRELRGHGDLFKSRN